MNLSRSKIRPFILFTLLNFFVLFSFDFQDGVFPVDFSAIALLIMLGGLVLHFFSHKRIDVKFLFKSGMLGKKPLFALTIFSFLVGYLFLVPEIHETYDFACGQETLSVFIYLLLGLLIPLFFFALYMGEQATLKNYIVSGLICCCLLFVTTLFMNLVPSFKVMWITRIIKYSPAHIENFNAAYFRVALNGMVGDSTARVVGFYFILGIYLFISKQINLKNELPFLLLLCTTAVAIVLYARTGLLSIAFGMCLLFFNKGRFVKLLFLLLITLMILLALSGFIPQIASILNWAAEAFTSIFRSDPTNTTFNAIKGWFHVPPTDVLVYGTGIYTRSALFDYGDSGLFRGIYFFGLPGLLLQYAVLACFYRLAKDRFHAKADKPGVILCKLLLILGLIWEIKLPSSFAFINFFILLYWVQCIEDMALNRPSVNASNPAIFVLQMEKPNRRSRPNTIRYSADEKK